MTYDSGDYGKSMDRALALVGLGGVRQAPRAKRGARQLRGIGLANYIEITSGAPRERPKSRCSRKARSTS